MKNYYPYDIDPESIPPSRKITDEAEILKYRLSAEINKAIDGMSTSEIVELTGLNGADISRIRIQSVQRFSLDRLIKILNMLGKSVSVTVKSKKKAS